jgi:large subunit ribosomal protein L23
MAIIEKIKKAVIKEDETTEKNVATVADAKNKKSKKESKKEKTTGDSFAKSEDLLYYGFLREPYITEKTSMMGQENKYVFKVPKNINKIDVKKAVEKMFSVSVTGVAIVNTKSRNVRLGRYEGTKPGFKKAIITLKEGDKIDVGI